MQTFNSFMTEQGIQDIENLMGFIDRFLDDPSIFFDLSNRQLKELEHEMNTALDPFRGHPAY